jgi:hypothetical protein
MDRSSSPGRHAARVFLACLVICGLVAAIDHDAVHNPLRRAILLFILIAVPAGNYFMYRRRDGAARQ